MSPDSFVTLVPGPNHLLANQLLQSIVGRPGNCASWAATANQRLNMPSGGALRLLSNDADAEIPRNSRYPEREVLDGRQGRPGLLETARSCNTL